MRSLRKRLLNNWGLKLISLVLAFFLWFLVVQIGDPKDDRDMGNVQVKLINTELLEKENKVYEVLENTDTVRVTVYAPKSVFTQLRNSDIIAEADVSKLTDINTIPIELTTATSNVVSLKGSHDVVKLNVEDKASKYVTLMCSSAGRVAEGYVSSALTPDQNRIEVSGPKSAVEQVKYAGASIDVTDASSTLTANVEISLYDVNGNKVERDNLKKNTDYVKMTVEVLAVKEVPVVVNVNGAPKEGYMVSGKATADLDSVVVAGTNAALAKISEIVISDEVLDISDATENVVKVIDLKEFLPDNVKFADSSFNGKVTVTVPVEAIIDKTIQVSMEDIEVKGSVDNATIEIMESANAFCSVEIAGLKGKVDTLKTENIRGVIDVKSFMDSEGLTTLKAGNYTMPVTFLVGDGIIVKNSVKVKVVIKDK